LVPFKIQSSPLRSACVFIAKASDPEPGSLMALAAISWPLASPGK
jgi:hypothetical protein